LRQETFRLNKKTASNKIFPFKSKKKKQPSKLNEQKLLLIRVIADKSWIHYNMLLVKMDIEKLTVGMAMEIFYGMA